MESEDISPRMRKMLEKGRGKARKRVIDRGLVQFRADPNLMESLLQISEKRGIPLGTMLREWVKERVQNEAKQNEVYAEVQELCAELKSTLKILKKQVQAGSEKD